ncbi:MAG: PIN domain-containing protein [Firmicutes bacterium]|nr:PIN domain-containing protein [Bacillota bacterium]
MRETSRRAHVDANVVLRLLLGEPEAQARAAEALFARAARGEVTLVIHPAVLAEVVYVLTSPKLGAFARPQVAEALRALFALDGVEVADLDVVMAALRRFEETSLDWVDCWMLAYGPRLPVYTFDQGLLAAGGLLPRADG